ncbi:9773_t:CDS:2 [Ambispora gerdemannii]|uniref:9773_t:CDS:1 n=1 Tax=Ambispora gerdemannii TaxID=144530 RepID=A0A9N9G7H1_9GLOM|nr:9773_t:CDS:2 [Ambispora gerdemannii]
MDKALTPEYLNWHAKLVDSLSHLTDKIRLSLYRAYTEETELNPWIKSETPESSQIEKIDNHLSQDCIIKIFKFPEEKEAKCLICDEVHTHLGMWGDWSCLGINDHYFLNCSFRIDQKKVIIAIQSSPETQLPISGTNPNKIYQPEASLCQYVIEYGMDPEKFSVITEAEKKRWTMGCFRADLERDIHLYREGIKRNEDTRKYHKF